LIHNKGGTMSVFDRLTGFNLPSGTTVTMSYSEGTDVFVHNETAVDDAIGYTDVIQTFSDLIATPGLQANVPYCGNVLQVMRDNDWLDGYEPREFCFGEYIAETLTENFYDQEFIDASVQQYDYKRGFCTLETTVTTSIGNFLKARPMVAGWQVSVSTPDGTLTFD